MAFKQLSSSLSVSPQLSAADVEAAARQGYRAIIDNRPDREETDQISADQMEALAQAQGMGFAYVPAAPGKIGDEEIAGMVSALSRLEGPVLAYCRTGTRSATLWALSQAGQQSADQILESTAAAGYDLSPLRPRLEVASIAPQTPSDGRADVVIVGGGSAGLATAASLLERDRALDIIVIEPRDQHFYQPGWTMVGGGVFDVADTYRPEAKVMPTGVRWIKGAVATFEPQRDQLTLEDGSVIGYRTLVVAPGIALDWDAIDGLGETLGRNGVTSNYSFATAPYTWELVQNLREGTALFTQPPMPIKCAGAPQKAMYLSCDHWRRSGVLGNIDVAFHNAGAVLFGVKEFVPPLMSYVERYGVDLNFESTLIAVDGAARQATFRSKAGEITKPFDMIHVTPPQKAPVFLAQSLLANEAGYVDVDQTTLQHVRHSNVFGLGDGGSTPNAKTMAAARKQAPVVAENLLGFLAGKAPSALYDGYGSCPLTVERGKILLAEFGYGGKLLPSFPSWIIEGTKPQRLSWLLKSEALPWIYWNGMLKGREWMAQPQHRAAA
ncbi:bifunctional protein tyrosine phosphatase family protein/NAD(P)/FAD-dependent oxidoreductase (plasmid) [Sphingomonas naphthae]|uniref:Bifunctional protein tyrosine phosphatase family protein/NAD(P)/FAD-dependent oxidoreductase n=1 Tax=Sphingomonas naphthae TaxID=1813468 RepID=A0ABY7TSW8_9SPHN|nr:bifunctional protein tyrosine phosphatase family protein/NAD(P)/FAD-dependent oxidoreductase [Sphingomonas naphthae]WCT75747.1 bifunctional protein tyrosine phosphatase family protein/NAD(P)/FAD-dependent oxidoreductase [Sphingomonas naphthae]